MGNLTILEPLSLAKIDYGSVRSFQIETIILCRTSNRRILRLKGAKLPQRPEVPIRKHPKLRRYSPWPKSQPLYPKRWKGKVLLCDSHEHTIITNSPEIKWEKWNLNGQLHPACLPVKQRSHFAMSNWPVSTWCFAFTKHHLQHSCLSQMFFEQVTTIMTVELIWVQPWV